MMDSQEKLQSSDFLLAVHRGFGHEHSLGKLSALQLVAHLYLKSISIMFALRHALSNLGDIILMDAVGDVHIAVDIELHSGLKPKGLQRFF